MMRWLMIAAMVASSAAIADTADVRELQRVRVTHCTIDGNNPPVVVVTPEAFAEFGFELAEESIIPIGVDVNIDVTGEPSAEVGCVTYDSRVKGGDYDGRMITYSDSEYRITEIIYSVVYRTGSATFSAADWAFANYDRGNGAVYNVESTLLSTESGAPLDYDIGFLRRGVAGTEDPATIMRIQRDVEDGIVIFELDFTPAN